MSSLIIVKPLTPVAVPIGSAAMQRVLTPDPKEAVAIGEPSTLRLDMGRPVTADTAYVGYHTAKGPQIFTVQALNNDFSPMGYLASSAALLPLGLGEPGHSLVKAAPLTARYWQLDLSLNGGAGFTVGEFALGLAFQPFYGREFGSGRFVTDTGSAGRLFGGGFAINEGVVTGGWEWTCGELSNDELRNLYTNILRQVGNTRTVLAVEDPDQTDGLNERIHWGLLTKIDRYERFATDASRLSLRIDDWA